MRKTPKPCAAAATATVATAVVVARRLASEKVRGEGGQEKVEASMVWGWASGVHGVPTNKWGGEARERRQLRSAMLVPGRRGRDVLFADLARIVTSAQGQLAGGAGGPLGKRSPTIVPIT